MVQIYFSDFLKQHIFRLRFLTSAKLKAFTRKTRNFDLVMTPEPFLVFDSSLDAGMAASISQINVRKFYKHIIMISGTSSKC